ncbi:NACHT domain-containing protein [Grimontia sp. S25]|uniref:NACHT domain-containing protein n=1 Tax=Grimontia sedimenti TaxID=2711294 RepID=A0A6M1RSY3_9GAMM|nr:NACHT domain-containing protein [Grimontia sedimenti]NGN99117.1 NACHT domain-containing protein [Grimontia sedimenti]
MLGNLESKYKGFILVFFIMMIGYLSISISGKTIDTVLYSTFSLLALWIGRPLWLPSGHGKNKVRMYSLFIAFTTIIASQSPSITIRANNTIHEYLSPYLPDYILDFTYGNTPTPVLFFTMLTILIVNYFMLDNKIMGEASDSFNSTIPELDFKERLKYAIEALEEDIKSINKQTNWTGSLFTNLDAEVYIRTRRGKKKKASDLLKAMKAKSGRAFLVLGHPGAGKSIALRKLAQDLLRQAISANKIPIYINLKEWNDTNWSNEILPTESELYEFVKENIARRDRELGIFVDKYFDRLYDRRNFFFIFDSFDEIPQVMNTHNDSILIDALSEVLFKFIKDNKGKPTGILASRHFRKPTNKFEASREIEIRPFNESQVTSTLKKMGNDSKAIISQIFTTRSDLYLTAKNPFMASMLAKYIENHNSLPNSQLEMFSSFIDDSLDSSKRKLIELSITRDEIKIISKQIARIMFSDYGLEAPIKNLKEDIKDPKIDAAIECLKYSRIVRASNVDDGRISFVHRRFCEYFVVADLLEKDLDLPFSHIPKDSQGRDALVLYCEVASVEKAKSIAEKCWNVIKNDNYEGSLEAIHCIRFLRDAFKNRLDCIANIQHEIEYFIYQELEKDNPPYWTKLIIELLCLTSENVKDKCVIRSLGINDFWISQTALEACRSLPKLSKELEWNVGQNLRSLSDWRFFSNLSSYYFSFGISEAFSRIKNYIRIRTATSSILVITFFLYTIKEPKEGLFILTNLLAITCIAFIVSFLSKNIAKKKKIEEYEVSNQRSGNADFIAIEKDGHDLSDIVSIIIKVAKISILISPLMFYFLDFITMLYSIDLSDKLKNEKI